MWRRSILACRSRCWPDFTRVPRTDRQRQRRTHHGPARKAGWRLYPRFAAVCVGFSDGRLCRARSRQRHRVGHRRTQFCVQGFVDRKVDAFLGQPTPCRRSCAPGKSATSILNTTVDPPWSQYFCCMIAGTRIMWTNTRWRPSESCVPSSSPPTSARPIRSWAAHARWSIEAFCPATTYALAAF